MSLLERLHGEFSATRRVRVLGERIAARIPRGARVLEVGSGDGRLTAKLAELRPDVELSGLDVLLRPASRFEVELFDGRTLPHAPESFDLVLFVDVLHHTEDPRTLLAEARRVTKSRILIKDHALEGLAAGATLRFMDRVGNERYGVALPYNYWPAQRWREAFSALGLEVESCERRLGLYPFPLNLAFERSLHFLALLRRDDRAPI